MELEPGRLVGFKPHFSVHVLSKRSLLLLSEERSFRLSGALYVALAACLDGAMTVGEILSAMAGRAREENVRAALTSLLVKGYATYVDADAPRGRQALWSQLGIVPADAERALAHRSLSVRGMPGQSETAEAARALRSALADGGAVMATQGAADLVVVCLSDYLDRDAAGLSKTFARQKRDWMPAKIAGDVVFLGPLFKPESRPCWDCLRHRMLENRPGDSLVDEAVRQVRPALAHSRALLSWGAGSVAVELLRSLAEAGPDAFDGKLVTFDVKDHTRRPHRFHPNPDCPVCGSGRRSSLKTEPEASPVVIRSQPIFPQADGGWRIAPPQDVLDRLERYVSPITGIVAGIEDASPADGLPVFTATAANARSTDHRGNRMLGRPGAAVGKGISRDQAKTSCLAEAVERYLCGFTGKETTVRATWSELRDSAPHPDRLLNYSDRQYENRDDWNRIHDGFNWVGEPFDETRAIDWTPAWSLTHGAPRWVPTRFCYFGYIDLRKSGDEPDNAFCSADSNGCAAGSTREEAILQGLFEMVERDSCALWWYNRVRRPEFSLDRFDAPYFDRMRSLLKKGGRDLHVLDLTSDLAIPTAMAISYLSDSGKSIVVGLGTHLDPKIAISRAISEMNQMLTLEPVVGEPGFGEGLVGDEFVMHDWLVNRTLETEPYCSPLGTVDPGKYDGFSFTDLKDAIDHCVRVLADRGLEAIVVDKSRPEIDFSTVRVIVPDIRHFWARFRPGRLYDAPVELGWIDRPLREDELNPIPYFL